MVIRRREKPLTPQEAIDAVRREHLPFWSGSEPLLAGVPTGGKITAYPLDPRLSERFWILFFLDPLAIGARDLAHYAGEWTRRYEAQKLGAIVVLEPRHAFVSEPQWIGRWGLRHQVTCPIALDRHNFLARAFQVAERPSVVLLDQGQEALRRSGKDWFDGLEARLQQQLRRHDPGLPLFPAITPEEDLCRDLGSVELGAAGIPADGCLIHPCLPNPVVLTGIWAQGVDHWIPRDPTASLSWRCPGRRLGIVAQCSGAGPAELRVELETEFGKEVIPGADLSPLVSGHSRLLQDPADRRRAAFSVQEARLYRLFERLPASHGKVTLRLQGARSQGFLLYSLRFAD